MRHATVANSIPVHPVIVSCIILLLCLAPLGEPVSAHPVEEQHKAVAADDTTTADERPLRDRVLTGEDKERVETLTARLNALCQEGRHGEAAAPVREIIEIRRRVQGDEHWDTGSAGRILAMVERIAAFPREDRLAMAAAAQDAIQARALFREGRTDEALAMYRSTLETCRRLLGDDENYMVLDYMGKVGYMLQFKGQLTEAEPYFRGVVEDYPRMLGEDIHPYLFVHINNLGHLLMRQGRLAEAEPYIREALAGRRRVLGDDHHYTLTSMSTMGNLLMYQGRLAEAEPFLRATLAGRRRVLGDDHARTITALNNLGVLLNRQGKLAEAEEINREALAGRRRVQGDDHPQTLITISNMALFLKAVGEWSEAEALLREAVGTGGRTQGADHPDTLNATHNLAYLLQESGRPAEAEPFYRTVLDGRRRVLGRHHPRTLATLYSLGVLLDSLGRPDEAEPLLRRAAEERLRVLGRGHQDVAQSLRALARLLHQQGKADKALATWTEAAESFELARLRIGHGGQERVQFTSNNSPLSELAACLAGRGRPLEAWQRFEADLARGLLDMMSTRYARPLSPEERNREETMIGRLARLDEKISALAGTDGAEGESPSPMDRLRRERDTVQADLARFVAELSARHGMVAGEVYPLDRIQARLSKKTALLGWVDVDKGGTISEHWACVVRREGDPLWIRLPGSGDQGAWTEEDRTLTQRFRRAMDRRARASTWRRIHQLIEQLHRLRLAPVEPFLEDIEHLVVLPAGWMGGVPVEALTDRFTISYAPSGTMYAWLKEQGRSTKPPSTAAPGPLLALGDPDFSGSGEAHEPLPGTRQEVQALAELFKPAEGDSPTVVLLGPDASEAKLDRLATTGRLAGFRHVHLATHGVMDDTMASRSALILSRDDTADLLGQALEGREVYDGRLTSEQIVRTWKLDADLVTLSGCETALGREAGGEGFLGFSQSLFVAGARSLLLSLWKVDDRATTLLMRRFYENLLGRFDEPRTVAGVRYAPGSPVPRADALREAKNWLRTVTDAELNGSSEPSSAWPFSNPRYWAAFILIGDPE